MLSQQELNRRIQVLLERVKSYATLSSKEREVLGLLVCGLSNKEVGRQLSISHRTVQVHRGSIYGKIAIKNISQLQYCLLIMAITDEAPARVKEQALSSA